VRILVVEDQKQLAAIIKRGLREQGYAVDIAYEGDSGQYLAENTPYDLILLDIMLPKKDGLAVCHDLRANKINTPIIILTAKDKLQDKVEGLDCGADDYVIKPFAFPELLARVRAQLRRGSGEKPVQLVAGTLVLDPSTRLVTMDGQPLELTAKEYSLLEFFLRNPNRLLTRTMLEQHVWDYEFEGGSNIIDVYIRRLREKIDKPRKESMIQTIRGAGYRLAVKSDH
jgi:DNA-binding response OmpR family regulator